MALPVLPVLGGASVLVLLMLWFMSHSVLSPRPSCLLSLHRAPGFVGGGGSRATRVSLGPHGCPAPQSPGLSCADVRSLLES